MPKILLFFFIGGVFLSAVHAEGALNPQQIEQLREYKIILQDVDSEPLDKTIVWLEGQEYPLVHFKMMEAVAQAYQDLQKEYKLTSLKDKRWLYQMIKLNLAYLQFSGGQEEESGADANKVIQHKLKEHLPPEIFEQPGFKQTADW